MNRQTVLVTGAATGLGRACAIAFGKAGARVVVNHLAGSERDAEAVCREIAAAGSSAAAIAGDVSREDDVDRLFAAAIERFGTVHILVNNAGIQRGAPFERMTVQEWRAVIDVNLTGQFLCARAAIREFLRRGMEPALSSALGKIICMSSVHQVIPWSYEANYAASKGGVALLMQSLAQEFSRHRVRVNAIAPGAVRTQINRSAWETEAALSDLLALIPYGRIGEPGDVANAALWLASDLSDYVVGTTLFIDGGMALYASFRGAG